MGAISLYRGNNLHRVPGNPIRRWAMPPHALSLPHFKLLIRKRSQALARLLPSAAAHSAVADNGCSKPEPAASDHPGSPQCSISQPKIEEDANQAEGPILHADSTPNPPTVSNNLDIVRCTEDRKRELEKKLQVLNEKKHNLVQMLKQILNAEEEIKRRSIQSPGLRAYAPVQAENVIDMGSVNRHGQKLSVEVNFGGESDAAPNLNFHPHSSHPVLTTSPSAAFLMRPTNGSLQHNTVLHTRSSTVAATMMGSTTIAASPPPRVGPTTTTTTTTTSLPPSSVVFKASTPSPASGASSVFRDSRLTTSS